MIDWLGGCRGPSYFGLRNIASGPQTGLSGPVSGTGFGRKPIANGPKTGPTLPGPSARAVWDRFVVRLKIVWGQGRSKTCPGSPARGPEALLQHILKKEGPWQPPNPLRSLSLNQNFGGPSHFFPPGNPSMEAGGEAAHLNAWVPRREETVSTKIGF